MAHNMRIEELKAGLDEYRQALLLQRNNLHSDYVELQQAFDALWDVYGGNTSEEFQQHWNHTADWFGQYLEATRHLERFLEERIEALRYL
jgi:hypothetical protein